MNKTNTNSEQVTFTNMYKIYTLFIVLIQNQQLPSIHPPHQIHTDKISIKQIILNIVFELLFA